MTTKLSVPKIGFYTANVIEGVCYLGKDAYANKAGKPLSDPEDFLMDLTGLINGEERNTWVDEEAGLAVIARMIVLYGITDDS
jgi:hypothetical protein